MGRPPEPQALVRGDLGPAAVKKAIEVVGGIKSNRETASQDDKDRFFTAANTPGVTRLLVALALGTCLCGISAGAGRVSVAPDHVDRALFAGRATDLAGRLLVDGLKARLGQPVVMENKPGGNGVIGMREVVNAARTATRC